MMRRLVLICGCLMPVFDALDAKALEVVNERDGFGL